MGPPAGKRPIGDRHLCPGSGGRRPEGAPAVSGTGTDGQLAGCRVPAKIPGKNCPVILRAARPEDEEQLIALCTEEHEYHNRHTTAGRRGNPAVEATRKYVSGGFEDAGYPRCLVAVDPDSADLVGCLFLRINEQPPHTAVGGFMPRRRGFIGLTSVTQSWRGRGVGSALFDETLRVLAAHNAPYAFLFYVESNPLSNAFWNRRGFSPVTVDMAGELLVKHCSEPDAELGPRTAVPTWPTPTPAQ